MAEISKEKQIEQLQKEMAQIKAEIENTRFRLQETIEFFQRLLESIQVKEKP